MRISRTVGVVLCTLILTSCTGISASPDVARLDASSVPAPAWLTPQERDATVHALVAPGGSAPALLVGTVSEPAAPGTGTVWIVRDAGELTEHPLPLPLGDFSPTAAGSDELTVIAGRLWLDGVSGVRILTSADRESWRELDLPSDLVSGYPGVATVAVHSDVGYAILVAPDGGARGVRLSGGAAVAFDLPEVVEGLLNPIALAADGRRLVLIARPGPEGDPSPPVAFVSEDGGESWHTGASLDGASSASHVSGVVALDSGYVVTGSVPASDSPGADHVLAAWASEHGEAWHLENVPISDAEQGGYWADLGVSVHLGAPVAWRNELAAVSAHNGSHSSGIYTRSSGGVWSQLGVTNATAAVGAWGFAVPLGDGGAQAVIGSGHFHRWGEMNSAGQWTDRVVISEREDVGWTSSLIPTGSEVELIARIPRFEIDGRGWRSFSESRSGSTSGGRADEVEWSPKRLAEMTSVHIASNDEGDEVRVGSDFVEHSVIARGWFQAAGSSAWESASGFPPTGAFGISGVAAASIGWAAYGEMRENTAPGATARAAIVLSPDGVNWQRQQGEFGSGPMSSSVLGLCDVPSGDVLAVGWMESADGSTRTAAWMPDSRGWWRLIDVGELGEGTGFARGCATGESGVVISVSSAGRDVLARTGDGFDWVEVHRAERGNSVGVPVAVEGGFVAAGSYSAGEVSGPAVWLSRDGATWTPALVPSARPGSVDEVAPWGDALLIAQSGRIGAPLLRVSDIADVIARATPFAWSFGF